LYLWLTLNFPDLCISPYTYTATGAVAPARRCHVPHLQVCRRVCQRNVCVMCVSCATCCVCDAYVCLYVRGSQLLWYQLPSHFMW